MRFQQLDLNLLRVFATLMQTRSVTLAGQRLGLSQSATSNALQRLRDVLNDPLFVRTPQGMQPSALALELEGEVRRALEMLRAALEQDRQFEPSSSQRTFRVMFSDIAQIAHMPSFVSMLRRVAPGVNLANVALPLPEVKQAMAAGELDLAVGFIPDLGADFRRQTLFADRWVCVISQQHPRIGQTLSRRQYLDACHVSYQPSISVHASLDALLAAQFADQGVKRRIMLSVPYSSGLASTIAESDLLLTAPLGLARAMCRVAEVRILPLPFKLPAIDLNHQWHERTHRDPGNLWFRQNFAEHYRTTWG